jgi:ribokinase
MSNVVVVGSYNTDLVTYMPQLPLIGETVIGSRFVTGLGGKGSNQAVGAARLGADVTFIGCVGADNFGKMALQFWEHEGIHTTYVVRDSDHSTGVATIFVDDTGENMIAIAPGANLSLSPAHLDAAESTIAAAKVMLIQLEIPVATVHHALKLAKKHNIITILNPAPAQHLPDDILALADYMTPNETEAEKICGVNDMPENLAKKMLQHEGQTVIVTMGAWGAIYDGQEHGHVPGFTVEAIDTVGGGDAFNAGLAVALAEGHSLKSALRVACATGALAVTKRGAAASMPHRAEVDTFLKHHPDAHHEE